MKLQWHTEKRKLSELTPAEYNPRKATEKEAKDLKKSLDKFSLAEPIVINKDNKIIGGHFRVRVLKDRNEDMDIEVSVPNRQLTDKEERELNIRLNKNTGQFDYELLANFDEELLLDSGFESEELDKIFQLDEDKTNDDFDIEVEAEKIKNCTVKKGDLFQLGAHKLMCGDATDNQCVQKLMTKDKANLVFLDPPYGVDYASKNKALNALGQGNRIHRPINGDAQSPDKMYILWISVFKLLQAVCVDGFSYYVCSPQGGELMMMMIMALRDAGLQVKHTIIWVKNHLVLGRSDYHYRHEPILYGWGKGTHKFYGGRNKNSVWEFDKPITSRLHPTMKPIALISEAIKNSSKRCDIVLDLFGGSGSTLIACEQTNRKCRMMEIDPLYCQVIIIRWETITGKKATKL